MLRTFRQLQAVALYPRTGISLRLGGRPLPPSREHLRRSTWSLPPPPLPPLLPSASSDALIDVSVATGTPWGIIAAGFAGFPLALWAYKCMMLVIFQRRIIYMGYLPPLARTTKIDPFDRLLRKLDLEEVEIESEKGVTLRGISLRRSGVTQDQQQPEIVLVYFQGNLGSPLSRLPLFSHLLLSPKHSPFFRSDTTLLAIPPRSYYLSTPSAPSQPALLRDYLAVLQHARTTYPESKIVLYGHSLGGSAACVLLASQPPSSEGNAAEGMRLVDALVLENPFPSVPIMIQESLYPSRWLPYHYLTGFVLDRWDALEALKTKKGNALDEMDVLFVSGEKDGLVKPELVRRMYEASGGSAVEEEVGDEREGKERGMGRRLKGRREWLSIKERSHDDTWMAKGEWGAGVKDFLEKSGVLDAKETSKKKHS